MINQITTLIFLAIGLLITSCKEPAKNTTTNIEIYDPNSDVDGELLHYRLEHLELLRMEYLIDLQSKELLFYINNKDNRLRRKEWMNYFRAGHTKMLYDRVNTKKSEAKKLIERSFLVKTDSLKLSDRI